jgi:hypothetical protein
MTRRPPEPLERSETLRRAILRHLEEEPLTARELSARVHIREREVIPHLEHLERSLRRSESRLVFDAAECLAPDPPERVSALPRPAHRLAGLPRGVAELAALRAGYRRAKPACRAPLAYGSLRAPLPRRLHSVPGIGPMADPDFGRAVARPRGRCEGCSLVAASAPSAAATTAAALSAIVRLVHAQAAATHVEAVQCLARRLSAALLLVLNEPEAARTSRIPVRDHVDGLDRTVSLE